ncbi:hypothetical protein AVEN_40417-1 [Araneus ventricosus]|uniref:Uncharacterized protein n=1 Tax=Araneus ventricosus TaxID=182803 RepID=A0A4Y2D9X4_ARAVE|nr:hypothetical protein AVEN_40417-1 [Araneus ventricosus]
MEMEDRGMWTRSSAAVVGNEPIKSTSKVISPKLHKILWVAVSSRVGLRVERRHHLKSVYLQDVVLVDQTDENSLGLSLVGQCYSIHLTPRLSPKRFSSYDDDDDENMTTFNTKVLLSMRQQPKEFHAAGIGALIKRWDKCINIDGELMLKNKIVSK